MRLNVQLTERLEMLTDGKDKQGLHARVVCDGENPSVSRSCDEA